MSTVLKLDDIQSGVLRPRPTPYAATNVLIRIDDRKAARELVRRVIGDITSAANPTRPGADTYVTIAFTFQWLKALSVPQESLNNFAPEFQQGMATSAHKFGDVGENNPADATHYQRTSMTAGPRGLKLTGTDQFFAPESGWTAG